MTKDENETPRRRKAARSPNYPYIDLETAITRVKQLYEHEYRTPAPWAVVAQHWDYTVKSSSMDKVVGALNAYGLAEIQGTGDNREIKLSERSLSIVEDQREDSPERDQAVRDAALSPPIHSMIRDKFGQRLPSDATIGTWLIREREFNPKAVSSVIATYRSSIQYSKLDKDAASGNTGLDENEFMANQAKPGDFVQWTSQGVARFPSPCKVLGLSEDGLYAFVEGTKTGIPMSELTLQNIPSTTQNQDSAPPLNPFANQQPGESGSSKPLKGTKQATLPLDSGRVSVEWPDSLTQEDYEDIKEWLKILERKIGRSADPDRDDN